MRRASPHPEALLARLGRAVRQRRRERRLSRRDLAAVSGISERFLAHIETGRGNPSILRLDALARALEVPLLGLLAAPGAGAARVALIGLRGAGKSTIGPRLARLLRARFVELDALIERAAGLPLAQVFELHGEPYYRRVEREVLARLAALPGAIVVATGGGLVTDPESFALLRAGFTTVWLAAEPEDHWTRVLAQGDRRPMADHPDAMAQLRTLLDARRPLYASADLRVDTSASGVREAVRAIADALRARGARSSGGPAGSTRAAARRSPAAGPPRARPRAGRAPVSPRRTSPA